MRRPNKSPVTKEFLTDNCTVVAESGCWNWNLGKNGDGYGKVRHLGVDVKTHRISWQLWKGNIPSEMFVCHKCDNPSCCNPDHLFTGTSKENSMDCSRKNRHRCKLTRDQVLKIQSAKGKLRELSSIFKVSENVIWKIRNGLQARCQ